jgi:hypothetical protein
MNEQEFNEIITDMNINNIRGGLVLEAKEYRELADACTSLGSMFISIAHNLEVTAGHIEDIAQCLVNATNTTEGKNIILEATSIRNNIEEGLRFNANESYEYFRDIACITDDICDAVNTDGTTSWSSFIVKAYEKMRNPENK